MYERLDNYLSSIKRKFSMFIFANTPF